MKRMKTVSIGIPAYLEEATIKKLLKSLLMQKQEGFIISEIIVIADGSTDKTVAYAREIQDKRIIIIDDKQRLGKSARLNQIFRMFTGDVLFLMDADIQIQDSHLLAKIINSAHFAKAGIVGINATPVTPSNFFEYILDTSVLITKEIAQKWNNGDNYLSFKGCVLGLNRKFAKSLQMPATLVNNDAYLYFAAKEKGYSSEYCTDAVAYYKSPTTFSDHIKQSSRYQSSREELQQYFPNLTAAYEIPLHITAITFLKYLFIRPSYTLGYLIVRVLATVNRDTQVSSLWNIAVTTKGA